ncbi:MAG: 50S ribosomal protein L11 methyltransferase [Thermoleophilia bacterium]
METIVWKGRLGPMNLAASPQTFRPTTITHLMADALEVREGDVVIDVGCGSGVLGVIAAKLGAAKVYGVDMSPDVVEVCTTSAAANGVADRMEFFHGDLFEPLPDALRADVIIGDVSGVPDAIAGDSGWFPSKTGGGPRGSELPMRMLRGARQRLAARGRLLLPTATLQDERALLDVARSAFSSVAKITERTIPLTGALAQKASIKRLVDEGVIHLGQRGSRLIWEARVWLCHA